MAFCTTCGAKVNGAFCTQCGTPVSAAGQQPPAPAPPPVQAAPPPQAAAYQAAPVYQAPVAPPPAAAPAQRKTSPLVWILVIVLGLFVLGGLAVGGLVMFGVHKLHQAGIDSQLWQRNPGLAASKMIAAFNPDVEVLHVDDGNGTITLRDKRNGKQWTMNFDDVKNGRFHMRINDDSGGKGGGTLDIGGDASKLPSWIPQYPGSKPVVAITGSGDQGEGGAFGFDTTDSPQEVMKFYQDKVNDLGLKTNMTANTADGGTISASEPGGRSLTVTVSTENGHTHAAIFYGRK